jgi:hypothetical protein
MKVAVTKPPGLFAEGSLTRVISETAAPVPLVVIEMMVAGISEPVEITLSANDLGAIVRFAKGSKVQGIRDVVS